MSAEREIDIRRQLVVIGIALLAGTTVMLWIGLRGPEAAFAGSSTAISECPQGVSQECDDAIARVRPIVQPEAGSADYATGVQEAEAEESLSVSIFRNAGLPAEQGKVGAECIFLGGFHCLIRPSFILETQDIETGGAAGQKSGGIASISVSGQDEEWCHLPGLPCWITGQHDGPVQVSEGLEFPGIPTFEGGSQGFGERTVETRCFLGIPCWLHDGGMIEEDDAAGREFSGLITY